MPRLCSKCQVKTVKGLLYIGPTLVALCPEHRRERLKGRNETRDNPDSNPPPASGRRRKG